MRIYCSKCNSKAVASEHEEVSLGSSKFYCQCLNVKECGHRFVMSLVFSHTLTPAAATVEPVLLEQPRELPPRVYCNKCGSKAVITSRDGVSAEFARLYCSCRNKDCGHRFVTTLAFSHALVSASTPIDRMLFDHLRGLPRQQRREMFEQLGMSSA